MRLNRPYVVQKQPACEANWKESLLKAISIALLLAVVIGAESVPANAQTYPANPVKIISDSAPGSAPDVILRIVADQLGQTWRQQVVVLNQPGAGGSLAARAAASSTPDGYTFFMAVSSTFVTMKGAASNIPVEVPRDFMPVSLVGEQPMFITVSPQTNIDSLTDLVAKAKQKPGEVSYAVSGRGRQSHLTGELLERRTGIKLLMIPYSGGPAQAMSDLATGRVHMLIEGGTALLGAMQAGKLRGIAVGSENRLPEFPNLPAAAETVPNFRAAGWLVLVAPLGTPENMIRKVSDDLRQVLTKPEVRTKLAALGSYTRPMSPQDTTKYIQTEQQTWGPILDDLARSP
jgi:tripartite-type tricarboxylate transporter receptor subunit TctC